MKSPFMKVWLPVSVAVHVVLLLIFSVLRLTMPIAEAQLPQKYIEVVQIPEAVKPTVPAKVEVPKIIPPVTPDVKRGNPEATKTIGKGTAVKVNPTKGPGKTATRAANLMTAKSGKTEVPPGADNGVGRESKGPIGEPSGPTYEAAGFGVDVPSSMKLAEEDGLEGTVLVSVTVQGDGSIGSAVIFTSSGEPMLDQAARRSALNLRVSQPAMKNGVPVSDTIRIRYTWKNGKPLVPEVVK